MTSKRNGRASPRFVLRSAHTPPTYYVEAKGTGTQRVEARWVSDRNTATHYPSHYGAKNMRDAFGLSGDVRPEQVK